MKNDPDVIMVDIDSYKPRDFQSAVEEITSGGRYYFLEEQLYYLLCARRVSSWTNIKARFIGHRPAPLRRDVFQREFRAFAEKTKIPLLIHTQEDYDFVGRKESDLMDYAFDFLIVTEKSSFARLLLANEFHFHHRAGIVSRPGFPKSLFEYFRETARRHEDVAIVCVHDASPAGLKMREEVRRDWFANGRLVLDAGLRPRDFLHNTGRMFTENEQALQAGAPPNGEYRSRLSARELRFLDKGYRVELANLGPRYLMTLLGRYLRRRKRERSVFFQEELDMHSNLELS